MAGQRIRSMVVRQWELITQLCQRRRGMTVSQISEATGASRATVYRDLDTLQQAGAPVVSERINGEVRYKVLEQSYPALAPTPLQVAALHLARHMMEPLAGTRLLSELDALLARLSPLRRADDEPVAIGPPAALAWPERVRAIDAAIHSGHRLTFTYQSVNQDQPRERRVDPISLRLHDGQLYLIAHDVERAGLRTFKVARIHDIAPLDEKAEPHPEYDEEALFAYSAKIWTGEPVRVTVRLSARVARFATEWPLAATQTIEEQDDNSILVHAQVAGTVEAMRWVLRWGRDAEALSPAELRQAVHQQLTRALERYRN